MRQLKAFVCAVLIITFLVCSFSASFALNENTFNVFWDGSGIYACESSDYSVTVNSIKTSAQYKYSYNNKVLSYCVTGGTLYTVSRTNQDQIASITTAKDGKIKKSFTIKTHNVSYYTQLCVDGNGVLYILDNRKHAEVYSSAGSYIKTTSNTFCSLLQVNGKVFASNSTGIYRLNGKSESLVCKCCADTRIYTVSKDYIATLYGNVYNINNGKEVLNTDNKKPYSITFSSKYIFVFNNKTISVYNRKNRKLAGSGSLNSKPVAICADGSRIHIIYESSGGFSVKKYKVSYFLSSNSTNNAKSSQTPTNISFGGYKTRGRYIFLPPRLTKAEFKGKISYKDYKLKFSSTRGLGTNTKVVFTKDNKSYTYTVVVLGDITGTGRITKNDVNIMFNILFGLDKVGGVYKTAADVNGDGKLSNIDLVMVSRKKDS